MLGGRGGSSGLSNVSSSKDYKEAYKDEMENAMQFEGAYALDKTATKESIAYQMYVHQDVYGTSLIADTRKEIESLKSMRKEVKAEAAATNAFYKSEVMSKGTVKGIEAAIDEKIRIRERAIEKMMQSRTEYEKYKRQVKTGNEKAKRRKGRWM